MKRVIIMNANDGSVQAKVSFQLTGDGSNWNSKEVEDKFLKISEAIFDALGSGFYKHLIEVKR